MPERTSLAHRERSNSPAISIAGLAAAMRNPWVAAIICAAACYKVWSMVAGLRASFVPADFSVYYSSAYALRLGLNPYGVYLPKLAASLGLTTGTITTATEPPTALLLFEPLTLLPTLTAYWTWQAVNAIALLVALVLMLSPKQSKLEPPLAFTLGAFAILYTPVANHFYSAQSKLIIVLLLVLMMRCMSRGWDGAAGLILACAGLLRAFPLLLVGYLLIRRKWRTLAFTALGLALGGVFTIALFGVTNSFSFIPALGFLRSDVLTEMPSNVAIDAAIWRTLSYFFGVGSGVWFSVARVSMTAFASVAILGITVKATLANREEDRDWRAFSLWIITAVLLSPAAWFYDLVLVLIAFAMLAIAAINGRASRRSIWMGLASYALTAILSDVVTMYFNRLELAATLREIEFVCLMTAYVSIAWFAVDVSVGDESVARAR